MKHGTSINELYWSKKGGLTYQLVLLVLEPLGVPLAPFASLLLPSNSADDKQTHDLSVDIPCIVPPCKCAPMCLPCPSASAYVPVG
jgi:hypothetical protein